MKFVGWDRVAERLAARVVEAPPDRLDDGQRRSVAAIATRLTGGAENACRGVIVADEVGMGKTRVASAVVAEVAAAGGRVAIVLPPGLQYQWRRELRGDGIEPSVFVHSLWGFLYGGDAPERRSGEVVLVSHGFVNWRMSPSTDVSRWGLLPALVAAHRHHRDRRWPPYHKSAGFPPAQIDLASAIAAHVRATRWSAALTRLDALAALPSWHSTFCGDAGSYARGAKNREPLERAVGWGLGRFDLIVIDEAHKSRDAGDSATGDGNGGSGLHRLLDHVVHPAPAPARLALTATPLALHPSEWLDTLARVGVPAEELPRIRTSIERYDRATRALRTLWRTSEPHRAGWKEAAADFETALRPYVLRRGKTEDPVVRRFAEAVGPSGEYRRLAPQTILPEHLTPAWRQVVMAAEALSATVSGCEDPGGKRMRLTLGNGHSIATAVAATVRGDDDKHEAAAFEVPRDGVGDHKRVARAAFWRTLIQGAVGPFGPTALYSHPQLVGAVERIEADLSGGEKVLVFGRFTAPMAALVDLLNARAKLRSLTESNASPWPAEFLSLGEANRTGKASTPSAVDLAAADQLGVARAHLLGLSVSHTARYQAEEGRRAWLRRNVLTLLAGGLSRHPKPLLSRLHDAATRAADPPAEPGESVNATLARALWELMPEQARAQVLTERDSVELQTSLAKAFEDLVAASLDHELSEDGGDDDEHEATWERVQSVIREEFSTRRGGLARTLRGDTPYPTRRLLQAAFNREHSFPRVLVAQSMVGREGLNLHEACRVVLLLHPEWNPGVVEQQIGRVDRIGSRWARQATAALDGRAPELPRIEVRSIVFGGTYDEHHWAVLDDRWRDLRSQLHGVVIPPDSVEGPEHRALAEALNRAAPSFAPVPR
jgi:hypothetical protein